jgi:hypothetical protein
MPQQIEKFINKGDNIVDLYVSWDSGVLNSAKKYQKVLWIEIEEHSIVLPSDEPTMRRTTNTGGPRRHRKVELVERSKKELWESMSHGSWDGRWSFNVGLWLLI